jgi:hypothetical protein
MSYRNLTPHAVRVISDALWPVHTPTGNVVSPAEAELLPPWELYQPPYWEIRPDPAGPARVTESLESAGDHAGIPIAVPSYGELTGLPEPVEGVLLIVSKMVADACPERQDLVWPADIVRDEAVNATGCRCLHRRAAESQHGARAQLRRDAERLRQHNPDWAQHLVDLWPASPDGGATLAHVANVADDVFSFLPTGEP